MRETERLYGAGEPRGLLERNGVVRRKDEGAVGRRGRGRRTEGGEAGEFEARE